MSFNAPNLAGISTFDWRKAPRQTTNNRRPSKPDLRPKGMHTFQKAKSAKEGAQ